MQSSKISDSTSEDMCDISASPYFYYAFGSTNIDVTWKTAEQKLHIFVPNKVQHLQFFLDAACHYFQLLSFNCNLTL